jgi:DNA-binding NarL/FixJ family response regulator
MQRKLELLKQPHAIERERGPIAKPIHDCLLPADVRHDLFLVIKKALNNVLKHSRASEVRVRVVAPDSRGEIVIHFQPLPAPAPDLQNLTPREKDVLDELAKGFLYKEIQEALRISEGTLRSHIATIYRKLHVHSRTEAVVKYLNR